MPHLQVRLSSLFHVASTKLCPFLFMLSTLSVPLRQRSLRPCNGLLPGWTELLVISPMLSKQVPREWGMRRVGALLGLRQAVLLVFLLLREAISSHLGTFDVSSVSKYLCIQSPVPCFGTEKEEHKRNRKYCFQSPEAHLLSD